MNVRPTARLEEALASLAQAIRQNPSNLEALFDYAIVCGELGRWKQALAAYERILQISPGHALAWNNRGNVLLAFGRLEEALASYERALRIQPQYADAANNRAAALHRLNRWEEALAGYDQALRMQPAHADAHNNRAMVLGELGRCDEALAGFDRALALRPTYAQAHSNKARVLQDLGRWSEALENLEKAVALDPSLVEAQWNRALLLLRLGDFERGWPAYEWRWKVDSMRPFLRDLPGPFWSGNESLSEKTILLHAEQGIGDTLQFSRYMPMVAEQAAHVIVEAVPEVCALLAENFPGIEVIERSAPLPRFDLHCALGSLPLAFRTTPATIPPPAAIRVDDGKARTWRARLGARTVPRVGLAWAGNPRHVDDRRRSMPFEKLLPLLRERADFHVLQTELRTDAQTIRAAFPNVHLWTGELRDFSETAALVSHLDLVVTVDTAVAHLAASMGKPVWIMVASVPDFRWMLARSDSPWYPTVRLFRQPRSNAWESVVAEVRRALAQPESR